MATIHLIEGPVGAGKSTFAGRLSLAHSAPVLNLDEWMVRLFSPDRPATDFMPWYSERKQRCVEQIWSVTESLIDSGVDVILELGLVQRLERDAFYARVDVAGYDLSVYLLDAPRDVRLQRVRERNQQQGHTFQMEVSDEIFEIASNAWQAPDDIECRDREIQII